MPVKGNDWSDCPPCLSVFDLNTGACVECLDIEASAPLKPNMWVGVKLINNIDKDNWFSCARMAGVILKKYAAPSAVSSDGAVVGFFVGQRVEANYRGRGRYYSGKIGTVNSSAAKVLYDDGEVESEVPLSRIRKISARDSRYYSESESDREEESKIEVFLYDVLLIDGKTVTGLPRSAIYTTLTNLTHYTKAFSRSFSLGDKIEARYNGKSRWYPGKVVKVNNGKFDITYDDGEEETNVDADLIRYPNEHTSLPSSTANPNLRLFTNGSVSVGVVIFGCCVFIWHSTGKFFASILKEPLKKLDRVLYSKIKPESLTYIKGSNRAKDKEQKLTVKQRVLAQFEGRGRHYPGRIDVVNSDGSYCIRFDDGDEDKHVEREHIKLTGDDNEAVDSWILTLQTFPSGNTLEVKHADCSPFLFEVRACKAHEEPKTSQQRAKLQIKASSRGLS